MALSRNSLLTNPQKATLAQIARKAYNRQDDLGLIDDAVSFADWRHSETFAACGISSFRKARQSDFTTIRGHFENLSGDSVRAFDSFMKEGRDIVDSTQTFWHLQETAQKIGEFLIKQGKATDAGAGRAYILVAARRILKRPSLTWDAIADLHPDTIAKLVFNARRNLKSLRDRAKRN